MFGHLPILLLCTIFLIVGCRHRTSPESDSGDGLEQSVATAQAQVPFPIARPSDLPPGYAFSTFGGSFPGEGANSSGGQWTTVSWKYESGEGTIAISQSDKPPRTAPADATPVEIGEVTGYIFHEEVSGVSVLRVLWSRDSIAFEMLGHPAEAMDDEQLLRVARSLD